MTGNQVPGEGLPNTHYLPFRPEQIQAIEKGPGWVVDPAEMATLEELEKLSYRKSPVGQLNKFVLNSFFLYFSPDSILGHELRKQPYFQRFAILYPEHDKIAVSLLAKSTNTGLYIYEDKATHEVLRLTYSLMSNLVDENDPYVRIDKDEIDRFLLIR